MGIGIARPKAGNFALERYRRRHRAWLKRLWWVLPIVATLEIAVCAGVGLLFYPAHVVFFLGVGVGVGLALVFAAIDSPPAHIDRWRQGGVGERQTERQLNKLKSHGWRFLHDVPVRYGNIDHIAVGPAGVFLLETKWLHGSASVEGGRLTIRWREDPEDGYDTEIVAKRARAAARRLHDQLAADGHHVWVQPAVVLWARFEQRSRLSGAVAWIRGDALAERLGALPPKLAPDTVAAIHRSLRSTTAPS